MSDALPFCGCCDGVAHATPASVANRPGLGALALRVGTYGTFRASMHASLGEQPALAGLTTRDDADPTLALIDAWAVVLDVLTFYQERIGAEAYLRTATERRSVLALARQIGYELAPGRAADAALAFTLQTGPGTPETSRVAVGTQVQSVPGQDEVPQTFETVETITARAEWQAMRPERRVAVPPRRGTRGIWLEGVDLNLRPGDGLLLVGAEREADPGNERWDFRPVQAVTLDRDRRLTHVTFDRGLGSYVPPVLPSDDPTVFVFRQRAALFGAAAPDWNAMPTEIQAPYTRLADVDDALPWGGLLSLQGIAALPDLEAAATQANDGDTKDPTPLDTIYLAGLAPEVVPDSWLLLARPGYAEVYTVDEVADDARVGFTLSAKTTRLQLSGENLVEKFDRFVRETVVYAAPEALVRAEAPVETDVSGATVRLEAEVTALAEGQLVSITGTDLDSGALVAEVREIDHVETVGGLPEVTFTEPLAHRFGRDDVGEVVGARLNANVARATHGKTVAAEVLGSGDGSVPFQRFTLTHVPLTHVGASGTASGVASTLALRVDGVLWAEVPSLYGQAPDARVYTTRLADDGTVAVQFGDGVTGARLPTGVENVTASYRYGIGTEGLVDAGAIRLPMSRPFGVKDIGNPDPSADAASPETLATARETAPTTVLTLDRVVSVQDAEDYARAFAGVGKALASVLWSGERQIVHLTVAGEDGATVGDTLLGDLRASIDQARHVGAEVVIAPHLARTFTLAARVAIDPAYEAAAVLAEVEAALAAAFAFEARRFGQGVASSEVLAVAQAVPGVVYVDLDTLDGLDAFDHPRIPARAAHGEGAAMVAAELLTLADGGASLTALAPDGSPLVPDAS